ncbi:MAG: hypothetical protein QM539_07660 [Alphaproteobacteria bacterium]|nr:hypothetical protein [Alphaproteobacteria bacterium]
MKNIFFILSLGFISLFLTHCKAPQQLEIKVVEGLNFDISKIKDNKIGVNIIVHNPNKKSIDIEKVEIAVYLNHVQVGIIKDPAIYTFLQESTIEMTLYIQILPDAIPEIMKAILPGQKNTVVLTGYAYASSMGFTKKLYLTKTIQL